MWAMLTHLLHRLSGAMRWPLLFASWTLLNLSGLTNAALNDTGIKTCSSATQNGLPCPVAGFPRQDAEFGTNSFNFTKLDANGNALPTTATDHVCVKDNVTGLIWEVKTLDTSLHNAMKSYTFDEAAQFATAVNAISSCGFRDWRVPTVKELVSIVNYGISSPGAKIDTDYFPNSWGAPFWTSTAYATSSTASWAVFFCYGWAGNKPRDTKLYARLVRGQQTLPSFNDSGNGTVVDNATGLIWAKCSEGQTGNTCTGTATTMSWSQALSIAVTSRLGGYSDWRLPNIKELQSIADYSIRSPSISTYFPNTYLSWFWTSSADANDSSKIWIVPFYDSMIYTGDRNANNNVVRLVRGGQAVTTSAPVVSTDAPSVITATSATLKGTVNPKGAVTTVSFDFGLTTTYSTSIAATPATVAATAAPTVVSAAKTGLNCGTTYHYRVKAVNSAGTGLGADRSFTTSSCSLTDFTITNVVLTPVAPVANSIFSVAVTVKNQGAVNGDGGILRLWSNQPAVQPCAAVGGNQNLAVGAIAAGASKVLTFAVGANVSGNKTLRLLVDATCVRAEANEANNQLAKTYQVTSKPDFVITNMVVTPATPVANGTFTLAVTVKNQSTLAGDGGYLDAWANQAAVPTCGATGNAWADVGILAAGTTKTLSLTLPAGTIGAKTARAFVDSWCEIVESNETNNQLTKAYSVQ